jgi:anthranilate phosphoribosyltransferase
MRALLARDQSPDLVAFRHAVILNAAAALLVAGRVATLGEGVPLAAAALDDGRARATLEQLVKVSNEK